MIDRPDRFQFRGQVAKLVRLERDFRHPDAVPTSLLIGDIRQAEPLFQPRETSLQLAAGNSKRHVNTMAKAIADDSDDLDPVAIAAFGSQWFLLDGHHRIAAYLKAGRTTPIPVQAHHSDTTGKARVDWAVGLSTELNSKEKLPMSSGDKQDAAWRLTVTTDMSKAEVHNATRISTSTIATMRRVFRALKAGGRWDKGLETITWRHALHEARRAPGDDEDSDFDAEQLKLRVLIKRLAPAFNAHVPVARLLAALEAWVSGVTEDLEDHIAKLREAEKAEEGGEVEEGGEALDL